MSFRKTMILLLIGSLYNDIILYQEDIVITLPKMMLFPVISILGLILLFKKQIYMSKLSLRTTITLCGLLLFSLVFNREFSEYSFSIVQSILIGIIYMFILSSIIISTNKQNTMSNLQFSLKVINICTFFNAMLGVFQSFTGLGFISERNFILYGNLHRAQGLLLDPNYFGQLMLFGLFISIFLYKSEKNNLKYFCTLIILLGIILSGSRSALLMLFTTIIFYTSVNKSLKTFIYSIAALIIISVTLAYFMPDQFENFMTIFNKDVYTGDIGRNSLEERSLLVAQAIEVGSLYWYKGVGVGNYVLYNDFHMFSHNTLAEMFAEYGVIGIMAFIGIFCLIPIKLFCQFKRQQEAMLRSYCLVLLAIISYVLMSLTIVSYYSKFTFLLFALMIVMDDIMKRTRNEA
ncbi:O-antigen ligase family protein [Anaerospora sp.]|uniref:O-antigen ligase family protein n=1 Tax=Anaerospora sp. TaxID=1960278 RepID=UPI00289A7262|nr:O-antigen ligase family protein [Anaerospora sp.]